MCTLRSCSSFMMFFSGDRPLVMCSGWSVKAFTKPFLFFSRNKRTINASRTSAVTLHIYELTDAQFDGCAYFSAWRMSIPVTSSVGMSDCSISTTKIREVTESIPPCRYKFCLAMQIVSNGRNYKLVVVTRTCLCLESHSQQSASLVFDNP